MEEGSKSDSMVSVRFQHGGLIVIRDGDLVYKGGVLDKGQWFDKDKVGKLDLLWFVWDLGYESCGPLYYKCEDSGKLKEIETDSDLLSYLSTVGDEEEAVVYVDSPVDDMAKWDRLGEEKLGAHKKRENIGLIDGMSKKRAPKEDVAGGRVEGSKEAGGIKKGKVKAVPKKNPKATNKRDQKADLPRKAADPCEEVENSKKTHGASSSNIVEGLDDEESDYSSDSDDELSYDAFDPELDDDGSDEEAIAELVATREGRTKLRQESSKRRTKAVEEGAVKLGPVGVDKGLEAYIGAGNSYAGLLGGDEEYIDSSDVDSFASSEEDESGHRSEERRKRKSRVYYDHY